MTRPVGRPPVSDAQRRVQVGGKVAPETAAWLREEQERTGEPWGRIVDRAVQTLMQLGWAADSTPTMTVMEFDLRGVAPPGK
jgi:hypothetical protein